MSQYGAYGYAQHGKGYRFILGHYYTGTTIGTLAGPRDRPRPARHRRAATSASAAPPAPAAERSTRTAATRRTGTARSVRLRSSGGKPLADCGAQAARRRRTGRIDDRRHRHLPRRARGGADRQRRRLAQRRQRARRSTQYVKGVIPNESPPSWPQAALRAQAVAARSFALTAGVGGNGFDLYDDTRSQVYEGLESETAAHQRRGRRDPGQVVMYGGKIAETYFSACSGGHTESVQNVFFGSAGPLPGRRPRPLRLLLPAARLDARLQRARKSAPGSAPTSTGKLKKVVVTKTRRLAADRLGEAVRHRRVTTVRGDELAVRARRLRQLDELRKGRGRQTWPSPGSASSAGSRGGRAGQILDP